MLKVRSEFFLLIDLWYFFFQIQGQGTKNKSSENDQLTCHSQSFFFLISREKNPSKISQVNQQSVLNL